MPPALAAVRLLVIALGVVNLGFGASPALEENEIVRLESFPSNKREPFFDKIEALDHRPWRYAKNGNFEILSRCSDETTRRVATEIRRQLQLLKPVWPPESMASADAPICLFLFNQDGWWETKTDPHVIPVLSDWTGTSGVFLINVATYDGQPQSAATEAALLRATGTVVRLFLDLQLRQRTKEAYWLWFGLIHFYLDLRFERDSASFRWPPFANDHPILTKLNDAVGYPPLALLPLEKFFEGRPHQDDAAIWDVEAGLFMRWALLADKQKHRAAFWRFAQRACTEPVTEALFKEHFKSSFVNVQKKLEFYLSDSRASAAFPPLRRVGSSAAGSVRLLDASAAELARFKTLVDDTIFRQPKL